MWSHTYIHCIEPSIHVMDSYLLIWIISMPASDPWMLVAVQKTVAFSKLQWKSVGMAPLAEKSCKLLSKTLRMYEPLRFSLSAWPPGSTRIWNSSIYKQKSRFTYTWNCSQVYIKRRKFTDTIRMLAIYCGSMQLTYRQHLVLGCPASGQSCSSPIFGVLLLSLWPTLDYHLYWWP